MAAPTQHSSNNFCSSPLQSKPRSSEVGNAMRRSFSGNPFAKPSIIANQRGAFNPNTPANSPSDYPRRHSVGRENMFVSLRDEDKENGRDQNLKPSKLRSPASSKGTKHFMSPTISAASKVNSSPRKKVLGERNEPIRTSISSFEAKNSLIEDCGSKPEKASSQKKEVSFDTTVSYMGENVDAEVEHEDLDATTVKSSIENYSDMLSLETKDMEKDCVNLDPSFEISPRVPCSVPSSSLAPLDADPSMPPYDPKTNYLSPRPQFLHYRPNPRIELYLNQENEGKRLNESFTSESNSDTDVTEEESQSENSQKGTDDGPSGDVAEEEKVEVEEENELPVNETTSIDTVEVKKVSKPQFFTRTKFTVFLLLVASACLCVSLNNSRITEANVLNNLSLYEPYIPPEFAKFPRNTFNDIAFKLQISLYDSLSCIHDFVSSFRDRLKIGTLQYANLTNLSEDSLVNSGNTVFGQTMQAEVVINEVVEEHEEDELQYYSEVLEDQSVEEILENEAIKEDNTTESDETLQSADDSIDEAVQEQNSVQEDVEAHNFKISDESEFTEPEELNMGSVEVLDDIMDLRIPEDNQGDMHVGQNDANAKTSEILENAVGNPKISESTEPASDDFSEISSEQSTMKICMLILSVLAATAYVYICYQRHPTKNAAVTLDQKQQTKTKEWQTEDMVGESCPSEMSSHQNSSAYTKNGLTRIIEAQSQERRPRKNYRRESLASSDDSTVSPSYGSFTTYQKIPTKQGYADEEVFTPVRRSSRIRNLVTSP